MASSFSTSDQDAVTRSLNVDVDSTADHLSSAEFEHYYEIERTVQEIVSGDWKRIALQFPDELLHISVRIFRLLQAKIGPARALYVLADTSYGSCCVDEVAAQHVDADAMVHYGHACMSQTYRLPVVYVFGRTPVDADECVARLLEVAGPARAPVWFRHDVAYAHQAERIVAKLRGALEPTPVLYSKVPLKQTVSPSDAEAPTDGCTIFYVGGESLGLNNLLITNSLCEVYSYDPKTKTSRLESARSNRLLMRRYAVMQKARDADVFGILVGTLGVASYLPLIGHLRALLARAHKKSYTISVGRLTPSKLANFPEIACFVLVACPENSLVDAKDFLRPIVTPHELAAALRAEQRWAGRYVLDFGVLMAADAPADAGDGEDDDDRPVFSAATGTYRHARRYDGKAPARPGAGAAAVVLRNRDGTVAQASAAGQFLQGRTYQGLEARVGRDAPSVLEQGRSGTARGYQDDH